MASSGLALTYLRCAKFCCPKLTAMPRRNPLIRGVAHIRGQAISIIDLSMATGGPELTGIENRFVIIAEYNRTIQGFLVGGVDRIININWEDVMPPPKGTGRGAYLTAVTQIEDELVEIIDVERILADIMPTNMDVSEDVANAPINVAKEDLTILITDDSSVARNQIKRALQSLGISLEIKKNGKEALDYLKEKSKEVGGWCILMFRY